MVGRDPSTFYKRERVKRGEVVLEVRNVTGNGVRNVSFDLHRGEVLGIAGMVGSGRSELMEVLFGGAPLVYGEIVINGKSVKQASPKSAIRNKMCFITEDRQNTGLFLPKTIAENVAVANMVNTRQFVARPSNDVLTGEKFVKLLNIKAPSARTRVVNLSGGNQQKVVLGKWFNTGGEIYIFDEPSRGIDVGSKQEIYKVMVDLLKEDKAILMVSSDMPEVISMSDRVIVFKQGEIAGELTGEEITEENILTLSIGDRQRVSTPETSNTTCAGQGVAVQATRKPDRAFDLRQFRRDRRSHSVDLDGRVTVPDFHQSGQHREHSSAGRGAGDRRDQHDDGDDIRRHRSFGRHARLAGVDRRRRSASPNGISASVRRSFSASRRRSSSRRSWGSSFPEPASNRSSSRSAE